MSIKEKLLKIFEDQNKSLTSWGTELESILKQIPSKEIVVTDQYAINNYARKALRKLKNLPELPEPPKLGG